MRTNRWLSALNAPFNVVSQLVYVAMISIDMRMLDRELKKGSAELIILSIVEARAHHGYEISKVIETRSAGQLSSTSRRCIRSYTGWRSAGGCRAGGSRRRGNHDAATTV
jgi:hypothetical protein